jgi:translation elongation factor EF-4
MSRSLAAGEGALLAAGEGALLAVDAAQGIEAQTLANAGGLTRAHDAFLSPATPLYRDR